MTTYQWIGASILMLFVIAAFGVPAFCIGQDHGPRIALGFLAITFAVIALVLGGLVLLMGVVP